MFVNLGIKQFLKSQCFAVFLFWLVRGDVIPLFQWKTKKNGMHCCICCNTRCSVVFSQIGLHFNYTHSANSKLGYATLTKKTLNNACSYHIRTQHVILILHQAAFEVTAGLWNPIFFNGRKKTWQQGQLYLWTLLMFFYKQWNWRNTHSSNQQISQTTHRPRQRPLAHSRSSMQWLNTSSSVGHTAKSKGQKARWRVAPGQEGSFGCRWQNPGGGYSAQRASTRSAQVGYPVRLPAPANKPNCPTCAHNFAPT